MVTHILAVAFSLLIYLFLGTAYYGWGRVTSLFLGLGDQKFRFSILHVWLGWATTLFVFELLHFILPLTAYVSIPVLAFGAACAVPGMKYKFKCFQMELFASNRLMLGWVLIFGFVIWVISRAMMPPINFDSGLYHFNTIRWINMYPVVPGLGNLHGRLAFNQSFFTYVAALNFYPYFGYGRSLANSFLLLLVLATVFSSVLPIIRQPDLLIESHPFRYISGLFLIPIIVFIAFSSDGIASPSVDLASTLLQLMMFVTLAHGLAEWNNGKKDQSFRATVLAVLAAAAVTVKLSNLGFSFAIIGFAVVYVHQTSANRIKSILRLLLPVVALIFVWSLRGYILSGAPFYPSTIGYIPLKWAVPIDRVADEANWIYSWARSPGVNWENVLGNWNWLYPWFIRTSNEWTSVVYPVVLTVVFCVIAVAIGLMGKKRERRPHSVDWAIFLPPLVSLVYWFFTAPDPRFAGAAFFLMSLCSILIFLRYIQRIVCARTFIVVACGVFLVGNAHFFNYICEHSSRVKKISFSGWHATKEASMDTRTTLSGLAVYVPKTGGQCWDSPLPSTPYFNDRLRLRNRANMSSGFAVTEETGFR